MHEPSSSPYNGYPKGPDMSNANDATKVKRNDTPHTKQNSWLQLPAPIRRLFDTFPLTTYDDNLLPQRADTARDQNTLHVFTTGSRHARTDLSLNPACLKWQAYLLVNRVPFSIVSANNHASPSGALPFLLPMVKSRKDPQPQAIASTKIYKWALSQGVKEEARNLQLETYTSLIDVPIRNAWLYWLYLQDENFEAVAKNLYIQPASSNSLVQLALAYQLRIAARDELLRSKTFIDGREILVQAERAFESLSTLLGADRFFSRKSLPNLFDLALFSYVHPLLALGQPLPDRANGRNTCSLQWQEESLFTSLQRWESLVRHHQSVLNLCTGR